MNKLKSTLHKTAGIVMDNIFFFALLLIAAVIIVTSIVKENGRPAEVEPEFTNTTELVEIETENVIFEEKELNLVMQSEKIRFTDVEIVETTAEDKSEKETEDNENTENKEEVKTNVTVPAYVVAFSAEDYNNFLRIVEAETTGGDLMSKLLVANVIINRVRNPYFPNTISGVIFQGNGEQFSPVADGRFYTVPVTQVTVEAVNKALLGEDYSMGATFFAAVSSAGPDSWHARTLTRLFEYGGHVYFK